MPQFPAANGSLCNERLRTEDTHANRRLLTHPEDGEMRANLRVSMEIALLSYSLSLNLSLKGTSLIYEDLV